MFMFQINKVNYWYHTQTLHIGESWDSLNTAYSSTQERAAVMMFILHMLS